MKRFKFIFSIIFLFGVIGFLGSCTKSSPMYGDGNGGGPGPGVNEVWIQGMAYNPGTITVNVGTAITWTNKDPITHTVTSDTGLFDSGNLNTSGIFKFTFIRAGTYPYHCTIHPYITGVVKVN
jgi:plastocyanin